MNSHRSIFIFIIIGLFLVPVTLAAENKVPRDGTVYVGEADLDISDCAVRNGDEIAWWDSGNPQGTPSARARVDDVRRFTVDPETFKGHTGTWFGLISKKTVFKVEEPFLQVDLIENGIDREPSVIKRGSLVSFKISTTLAGLSKRPGSSGALVSLNLTGPNSTEYHTLSSPQTNDFNLDSVYVWTTPYDTGVVWDTANKKKYPDGEYTLSASTKVNRIDEIYHESGITYTEKQTFTISDKEVKPTPTPTETPEEKSSTKSNDKVTEEPTEQPTEAPTEEITTVPTTVEETSTPTEEPTEKITPSQTRKPLPRPPTSGSSPSPTNASPLHPGIAFVALIFGALMVIRWRW